MKNANGKGDSYRKVDQKQYDKNYAKAFKKKKDTDNNPDKVSQLSFAIWLEYIISAISEMQTKKSIKKGIAQAKKWKFSKNPPNILPKKKK